MTVGARQLWSRERRLATIALALPCLAGLVYLIGAGAPTSFSIVNAGALALGLIWIAFGRLPDRLFARRMLTAGLLLLLALPLALGPSIDSVSRWISLGGFTVHAGMLTIPLLVVLAAQDRTAAPLIFLAAMILCFAQPDTASLLALSCAALALWRAQRDWKVGALAGLGLFAALGASFNGALPPQAFVENVLPDLWASSSFAALALGCALLASLAIVVAGGPENRSARRAVAGAMAGFVIAAILGPYPYPLIGYGAAPILGFALALGGLARMTVVETG
ncbi:MAG: hypothetical protein AAF687_04025 [Pseudomonadota bacterium]